MKKIDTTVVVALITSAATLVFAVTFVRAFFIAPSDQITLPADEATKARHVAYSGEYPDRLIIPKLGIDARVQQVGISSKGNMAVPSNYSDVGWYKYGTLPGGKGSAVVAGHVDNGVSLAGVFKQLHRMKTGDEFYVITKNGTKLQFEVADVVSYPYQDVPTDILFNRSDGAWLNLVTCSGSWVSEDKTYNQRLIVYSRLVGID